MGRKQSEVEKVLAGDGKETKGNNTPDIGRNRGFPARRVLLGIAVVVPVAMFLVLAPVVPITVHAYFDPHPCATAANCNALREVTIYGSVTYAFVGFGLAYVTCGGVGFYWAPPTWH
jgi:hypothetical protein